MSVLSKKRRELRRGRRAVDKEAFDETAASFHKFVGDALPEPLAHVLILGTVLDGTTVFRSVIGASVCPKSAAQWLREEASFLEQEIVATGREVEDGFDRLNAGDAKP